jgi:hypothetical protein
MYIVSSAVMAVCQSFNQLEHEAEMLSRYILDAPGRTDLRRIQERIQHLRDRVITVSS